MSDRAEQLKSTLAILSKEDRVELAYYLLDSIDDADPAWHESWQDELSRRESAVGAGQATWVPAQEVFAKYRTPKP